MGAVDVYHIGDFVHGREQHHCSALSRGARASTRIILHVPKSLTVTQN